MEEEKNEVEAKLDPQRYYGIAWNINTDKYRRTGLLADVKDYVEATEKMFIHNSFKKQRAYKVNRVFYRHQIKLSEVILEISDLPLPGFYSEPAGRVAGLLEQIDFRVYQSFFMGEK